MHRIDSSTAVAAFPAPRAAGAPGYFIGGDPSVGRAPTTISHEWLNTVQEEIAGVIAASGQALDKTNNGQLLLAIAALISGGDNWSTGDVKLTMKAVADAGWVMMNDGSIGNAASGATTRANADTAALFALIWTNVPNASAPLQNSGGAAIARGATAAADFSSNCRLVLPAALGRAIALAGAGAGLSARLLGTATGAETHALTAAELPPHTHSGTTGNESAQHTHSGTTGTESAQHTHSGTTGTESAQHTHPVTGTLNGGVGAQSGGQTTSSTGSFNTGPESVPHTHDYTTGNESTTHTHPVTTGNESVPHDHAFTTDNGTGGGQAHSLMQPTTFLNAMIKL